MDKQKQNSHDLDDLEEYEYLRYMAKCEIKQDSVEDEEKHQEKVSLKQDENNETVAFLLFLFVVHPYVILFILYCQLSNLSISSTIIFTFKLIIIALDIIYTGIILKSKS